MKSTLLSASNVNVRFPGNQLFNSLNFQLQNNKHWAITGKSGAGKSILLQVLAGNIGLNGGSIEYHFLENINKEGQPVNPQQFIAFAGSKHHFKNLSNTADLYYQQRFNSSDSEDALVVRDYLQMVKINRHKPSYWTIDKAIDALNLTHLADKQIIKLSNGETKRLMIAAALIKNPLILLLDNPMTGLDVNTRAYFNKLFIDIAASGINIIMATSPRELPDVITDVVVLENGEIKTSSDKATFIAEDYATEPEITIDTDALTKLTAGNAAAHTYSKIVDMRNVHIQYGDKVILDGINWQINPGERWALLGPNGAGKSTLLSLINGDNPQAYANDIVLFDRKRGSGESIWDIKSKIGFVSPELYQYFPTDNSCLQVIESGYYDTLGLFRPSVKSRADLALEWMKALEIDKYARHLLKNIPASAQRLCLLARALIKNPALLIFDEPCQGLDDHQQQHFKAVTDAVCRISNVTLIYVTHYQHEIPDSVSKVLKLEKGKTI
ncbi:ATP-binding cassette domain-containing protein [Mucilaginibacter conchicola]|uniref:ATP-binding cassette domain-containing protein n=1 Tax=Mucilaginibacter conchicola TaxID=2303333 RepID=A0A372NPF4_9SPHI|nr:ATP-binding cassette domain-containing protein [Mucilaginibacter conchicola]RFZ90826.1 ATP-binding cassette domain-containing protein [Mucilaginibacter conchicola]